VLFDLSSKIRRAHATPRKRHTERGSFDAEDDDFHERVRAAYLQLAASESERIKIVNTNQPPELTHQRVKEIVISLPEEQGHAVGEKFEAASSENPK